MLLSPAAGPLARWLLVAPLCLAPTAAHALDTWWVARFELIDDPVQPDRTLGADADALTQHVVSALTGSALGGRAARPQDRVDHQTVLAAYWAALGAGGGDHLISGSASRKGDQVEVTLTLWSCADRARRAQVVRTLDPRSKAAAVALVEALRSAVERPREAAPAARVRAVEPTWVQPAPEIARPPPDTTNPWARGLVWGGSGLAAVGLVTGLVTYAAFAAPLEDPRPRSGADNDALLQTGRATGIVADAAIVTGLVGVATGVVLWLAGVGAEEVP